MIVASGSTIGIVGGGQLGRMLAMAAAQLGYRTHIYAPDEAPPAAAVAAEYTRGDYDDEHSLARFGASVDVATYEFENISAGALNALVGKAPLFPPRRALEIAQDRLAEKEFALALGGRPAPFVAVDDPRGLDVAIARVGVPAILKTRRFGYDGKGQARIDRPDQAQSAWAAVREAPAILEGFVDFRAEFSVLLCRGGSGEVVFWESPRNIHVDGILRRSEVPAEPGLEAAIAEGRALGRRIADALDYVGVLAIEYFAGAEGAIFNEMAPRVHNSGHWTSEGALTSQFENHIRALCGLPLGATDLVVPRVEMENLIGDDVARWRELLADRTAHVHLYG
ncbi:MAG TPA: 5-(carboxyamino)imidazole ribonucleotide synthase, partial [Allosphingosinicella sp.]